MDGLLALLVADGPNLQGVVLAKLSRGQGVGFEESGFGFRVVDVGLKV